MRNAKVMRNLVLLGVLVLCGLWSTVSYAAEKPAQTPSAIKKPIQAPNLQQSIYYVRGTVTAIYPTKSTGQGVKDIEVTLLGVSGLGRVFPVDTKTTDSAGRYAFTLSPDDKGKRYKIVPRFLQTCFQERCSMAPAEKEFTLQDSMTADFELYLPRPDVTISLGTMKAGDLKPGNEREEPSFEFEIKNKGYLPSTKSKVTLSFDQPCCPEKCVKEAEVPAIPAQGSTKILIGTSTNTGARGCGFTSTVATQSYEVKTDDNKVTGTSPLLRFTSIQVTNDSDFIYVRNKGTANEPAATFTWRCDPRDDYCTGPCDCPTLQPTSASSPVLTNGNGRASLAVNGEFVYRIPQRIRVPGQCLGCGQGRLEATWHLGDIGIHPRTAVVTLK